MPAVRRGSKQMEAVTTPSPSAAPRSPVRRIQEPEKVLRSYILWHESEGHSRKTETVYTRTLRPFFDYLRTEY